MSPRPTPKAARRARWRPWARLAARVRLWLARRAPALFLRLLVPSPRELGSLGEALAARHLARRGWRLVGRRLRTRWAEVDVVAFDGDVLVAVEVKTARVPLAGALRRWGAADSLSARQARRLARAAAALAAGRAAGAPGRWRVDLVEVELLGRRAILRHVPGAVRTIPAQVRPP